MARSKLLTPKCLRQRSAPRSSPSYDPVNRIVRIGAPLTGSSPEATPVNAVRYTRTETGQRTGAEITRGDHYDGGDRSVGRAVVRRDSMPRNVAR